MAPKKFLMICLLLLLSALSVLAQDGVIPTGDKILVWIGGGTFPGQHNTGNPGELAFVDGGDATQTVLTLPIGTTRALACGNEATSANGQHFAFFVGDDSRGTLYLMNGTDMPTEIKTGFNTMGCVGNGTFRFSPDSTQFAALDFAPSVNTDVYPYGKLDIGNAATGQILTTFEAVTAFDISSDVTAFISLFRNDQNEAVEAAVTVWDGDVDREVGTLFADEDCYYTSASVEILTPEKLVAMVGQKCKVGDGRTMWQLYTVDAPGRSATIALSEPQTGGFFSFSRTNFQVSSPDGGAVFFTVPDGVTNYTTGIMVANMESLDYFPVVTNLAVMPRLTNRPFAAENHIPEISNDGNWWGLSRNTANNDASLLVLDLANPGLPPIEISAGQRGDQISEILFTPDSSRLVYVAGGHSGGDNSLFGIDLFVGTDFRIRRGRYGQGVISPDGNQVAIINWQKVSDREPVFTNLVVIGVDSSEENTLFIGAQVNDNRVSNQQFIYPLAWRRGK